MKNLRLCFATLAISLVGFSASACSCAMVADNFCESIRYNEHVALVKVVSKQGSFMNVEIIESLRNTFVESSITVIGQDGFNCSEWLENFEVSDTLILGLNHYMSDDTLNLSGCGVYYLFYSNGTVTGNISPLVTAQSYSEFTAAFDQCAASSVVEPPSIDDFSFRFSEGTLNISTQLQTLRSTQVFDLSGKLVQSQTHRNSSDVQLDLRGLKPSVYLIEISTPNGSFVRKWAIVSNE